MFVTKTRRIVILYKSGISNLSDTLRKIIVFFSMEALTSTIILQKKSLEGWSYITSP